MHLAETTTAALEAATVDVALLPVGSTEQHGPHAPLGTDGLTAGAVADAAAEAHDGCAVVAPTVPVGVSEEHRDFPGTLWVQPDTFRAYVGETVASLAHHGWDRVVVVNGHGGNTAPLREVCGRLTRDGTALTVPVTWFEAVETELSMGHAGAVETSLLLATHPEFVAEGELAAAAADAADHWGEWVADTNLAYDTATFSTNGVVGDPTEASRPAGERLLAAGADAVTAVSEALIDREWPEHRR